MELPKNITQIGEANRNCKIYVEDYVVSYMKQLNQLASNKDMAVALYGKRRMDKDVTYLFIYGACKLDFLQRETRHLSQAQQQEIEKLRRKYFAEYEFQGYRLLNGEMVEGFHICEQDICRYIAGYAQFYEKNDSMLAYMLEARPVEIEPESVNQEKYDVVRRRQEERRGEYYHGGALSRESDADEYARMEEIPVEKTAEYSRAREDVLTREQKAGSVAEQLSSKNQNKNMWKMRVSTAAVFGMLCLAGLSMIWDQQGGEDLQAAARQVISELTEQKLPDAEVVAQNDAQSDAQTSTLVAEEKLTAALQNENAVAEVSGAAVAQAAQEPVIVEQPAVSPSIESETEGVLENGVGLTESGDVVSQTVVESNTSTPIPTATPAPTATPTPPPVPSPTPTVTPVVAQATASYVIQPGDTLIGICLRQYGSDSNVETVCELNGIDNPDDIKIGQKILLP